jgi:hypothetical protein
MVLLSCQAPLHNVQAVSLETVATLLLVAVTVCVLRAPSIYLFGYNNTLVFFAGERRQS